MKLLVTHERFARLHAERSGAAFLLPDDRLAPGHPAPVAIARRKTRYHPLVVSLQ